MDLASLIGLIGAVGMILAAMIAGGGVAPFIDTQSILIVFGGTFFGVMYSNPLPVFLGSFGVMAKAFLPPVKKMDELVERMSDLASIARKDGMMALEGQDVPDKFFQKGLQMLVDGADEAKLVSQLNQEIKAMKLRHEANQGVVKGWIDIGPAMGMIGTLIGLVQMLSNMEDPKSIGPAMAVALLTTLYGAMLATMICLPIADKLNLRMTEEARMQALWIDAILAIQEGTNPRVIEQLLRSYLPENKRDKAAGGEAQDA